MDIGVTVGMPKTIAGSDSSGGSPTQKPKEAAPAAAKPKTDKSPGYKPEPVKKG